MLRINIRQLYGRYVQERSFSVSRSLFAKKNERVERSSEQFQSAGAELKKEAVDDVLRQSCKPIGAIKKSRDSVAQRLFKNEVDEEVLAYPEVVDKSTLDKINEANSSKDTFFRQQLNIVEQNSPVFKNLKKFDVFKHNIQTEYGGLAYSATEMALASEPEANSVPVAMALSVHRNVCSAIGDFGSISQKEKYLPLMATGDLIGTTCVEDKEGSTTKAELDEDADEYILNGSKVFVVNPVNSQLFLVFAQTRTHDVLGDLSESLSAFLVEAGTPGVTISKRDLTIGNQHIYQSAVTFKNARVKSENWISIPGNGYAVFQKLLIAKRLQQGVINIGQMRSILDFLLQHCQEIESRLTLDYFGKTVSSEAFRLRDAIARAANAIYASESAVYLTTGIADVYDDADIMVEAAIVKIYTQERLFEIMSQLCSFLNADVTMRGHPMEEKIRDAIQLQAYDEPKEHLKLYIGVSGIQYFGIRMFEEAKTQRHPLLQPKLIMKALLKTGSTIDNVELKLNVQKHLHPALDFPIKWFEESVGRLNLGVEILISDHARDLPQQHCKIARLADACILNYVSMATLSRASRALCHKFDSAPTDHAVTGLVCEEHRRVILDMMKQIEHGSHRSFDGFYQKVSEKFLEFGKNFTEHPLKRFF